ncbi:MAG: MerR family transcriptional regulator [Actinomycetes bacterium]
MAQSQPQSAGLFSIGEVLTRLRDEFSDISISKIRFLEAHGLIAPSRTASGYRKFSVIDVDRLRYILRMQRDHFLPLRVIRDHIEAMDRGLEPPTVGDTKPTPPRNLLSTDALASSAIPTSVRLTLDELVESSGATDALARELIDFGLLVSDQAGYFDSIGLNIARVAQSLNEFGLEARHLKTVLSSASRELDLFAPIIKSARSGKNPASLVESEELTIQLATSVVALHELLVRSLIEQQR